MSDRDPNPLTPNRIDLDSPFFEEILGWIFTDTDSYVGRLLQHDIPQRIHRGPCRLWIYLDPDGRNVGFGALDERGDYSDYVGGQSHLYIPLLAVKPGVQSRGYGTSIVKHLVDEAVLVRLERENLADILFLDVYADNRRAIELYQRLGFRPVEEEPTPDPDQENRPYLIMAAGISIGPS